MPSYDVKSPKKSVNVSINGDLLRKGRALKINFSALLEQALAKQLQSQQRAQWLRENRDAIDEYNDEVVKHGVFSDGSRLF